MSPLLARAALLAALALALSAPARADETADGSGDAPFAAADKNQDGTVTNREQRRYNRAQRRTRRAKSGTRADDQDAAEAADEKAADAAQGRSASVMGRASAAAEGLKNSMPSADAGALPTGGAAGAAGASAAGGRAAPAGSGDPSNPKTAADFALAARSGYAPAFTASGLKLSADGRTVVRADGSPATADDLTRLRFAISTMPAALVRRPDFFARVSPEHFSQLVRGYHDHPALANTVYKHVGPTAGDRDLVHTESCSKVSGGCNASVEKTEYKKGDFVAPEDLDRMWGALQKELDQDDAGAPGNGNGAKNERSGSALVESTFDGRAGNERSNDTNGGQGSTASGQETTVQGSPVAVATAAGKRIWRAAATAFGFTPGKADDIPRGYALGALGVAAGAAFLFGLMRRRR